MDNCAEFSGVIISWVGIILVTLWYVVTARKMLTARPVLWGLCGFAVMFLSISIVTGFGLPLSRGFLGLVDYSLLLPYRIAGIGVGVVVAFALRKLMIARQTRKDSDVLMS
jgi:hypothetical protein